VADQPALELLEVIFQRLVEEVGLAVARDPRELLQTRFEVLA
jgi:hypothetical protein